MVPYQELNGLATVAFRILGAPSGLNSLPKSRSLKLVSGEAASGLEMIEIPIFPLPNVVLFPNTLLPLHIFEQRYRRMVTRVLDESGKIGMALLKQPWEQPDGEDIFRIGGMGEIAEYQELEDGKYDILLRGTGRYRLIEFLRSRPYLIARVRVLPEPLPRAAAASDLTSRLVSSFGKLSHVVAMGNDTEVLGDLDFRTLVNSICSSVNISDYNKQVLLEMDDLTSRAENVLKILNHLLIQQRLVERFQHLRPGDPCAN